MAPWDPQDGGRGGVSKVLGPLALRISFCFLSYFSFCLPHLLLLSYPSFLSWPSSVPIFFTPLYSPAGSRTLLFLPPSSLPLLFTAHLPRLLSPTLLSPTLSYPSSSLTLTVPLYLPYTLHLLFPCFLPSAVFSYPRYNHHFLPSKSLLFLTLSFFLPSSLVPLDSTATPSNP